MLCVKVILPVSHLIDKIQLSSIVLEQNVEITYSVNEKIWFENDTAI